MRNYIPHKALLCVGKVQIPLQRNCCIFYKEEQINDNKNKDVPHLHQIFNFYTNFISTKEKKVNIKE